MKLIKFIEEKFWLPFIFALVIGLVLPSFGKSLNFLIIPFLMVILFLTYLKTDFMEIISHIKKPFFLMYVLFMFLIVIPAIVFSIFKLINPELAVGFLLLSSMPVSVASPVLTNIIKGNTSLSIIVSLLSFLIAPFTVLLLYSLLTQEILPIDLGSLSKTMLLYILVPFLSAQIIKKTIPKIIKATESYYNFISILIVCFLIYIGIAAQPNAILHNPINTFLDVFWLYALFIFLQIAGYLTAFWRNKEDKIALSISKTYMNNSLALGLALAFFPPKIVLIMVLSEIPWNTTLAPFNYFLKKLK